MKREGKGFETGFNPAFADAEQFDAVEAKPETVAALGKAAERIYGSLSKLPESETMRRGSLEYTNFKDFYFVTPTQAGADGEGFGLKLYTEDGESRVMNDELATFIYFAPARQHREVQITIGADSFSRRDIDTQEEDAAFAALRQGGSELVEAIEAAEDREEAGEAMSRIVPEVGEHLARSKELRNEAKAFEEMTGMNRVSEPTAQKLLEALAAVEEEITTHPDRVPGSK